METLVNYIIKSILPSDNTTYTKRSNLPASYISPFDIPHILNQILYYLDKSTLRKCQIVCKHWQAYAAPISWSDTLQDDTSFGHSSFQWKALENNLPHIRALNWALSNDKGFREKRLEIFSENLIKHGSRLQTLTIQGSYNLDQDMRVIFPSLPYLNQLILQEHWTQHQPATTISFDTIFEHLKYLRSLTLRDNISISLLKSISIVSSQNARGLALLDVVDVKLTSQHLLDIAEFIPNLRSIKFNFAYIYSSIEKYQSKKTEQDSKNIVLYNPSQAFALDLSHAYPRLCEVTVRMDHPINNDVDESANTFIREILMEIAPRLRLLDMSAILLHDKLLEVLLCHAKLNTFIVQPKSQQDMKSITEDTLLSFIWGQNSLEVVDIGFMLNISLFNTQQSNHYYNTSSPIIPSPMFYHQLEIPRFHQCQNLRFIDLSFTSSHISYTRITREDFYLCRNLYRQLSQFTQLRVLSIKGKYFLPKDLKRSGFFQLGSLKMLKALSICLFQEVHSWSDESSSEDSRDESEDEYTGHRDNEERTSFLARKDLEWMINQWTRIKFLEFRGSFNSLRELERVQAWVNNAAGGGGKITVSDGRSNYITSVKQSFLQERIGDL